MKKDAFIEIAAGGIGGRMELLHEPQPPRYDKIDCVLNNIEQPALQTEEKMHTKEQLCAELARLRKQMKPFLADHAPAQKSLRERFDIRDFVLDKKEKVSLPHYGGPVGHAKKLYEAEVTLPLLKENQAAYFCCKGADYKAAVHVNNEFAGSHEGFFAPFEFDISDFIQKGKNALSITLTNDFRFNGNDSEEGILTEGDKLYAATGLGWDDPKLGWHHCPPGMGLYNDVYIEYRNKTHIHDLFVRPLPQENAAEVWIEIENTEYMQKNVSFLFSLYGQNFKDIVFEKKPYEPGTIHTVGMGDSLTEAEVKDILGKRVGAPAQKGKNLYKFTIPMENHKLWEPHAPYLYQLQAELVYNEEVTDYAKRQFGMRSFTQDTEHKPYGMFYLNGRKIRLRGANTMGFEQQDVLRHDFDQLIDDILLAKICNMNYWRLTQRPVQEEIYEYCDKLGLVTQTDLPVFGCMRRPMVCEALRQTEEMERLIRCHPCNVVISYINEPFPNAKNEPHRHLERTELEQFFAACDFIVHLHNPDRVIKHVDGDYDPPTKGMPDNHCYPMWYNGHGIDIGKLHKGHWMPVKPDWYYGCGEYGAEGLECAEVMKQYYPKEWLAEPFDPHRIVNAQTGDLHYFFYDTPSSMEEWIEKSQTYQAFGTAMMTEAFRRNREIISNAIHLFIDAWPSGWMKTIMDCKRNPKKAYFAYKNALEPIFVSLRTDRFTVTSGETVRVETILCNDTNRAEENLSMHYEVYEAGTLLLSGTSAAALRDCDVSYVSDIVFTAPMTSDRTMLHIKAVLTDRAGSVLAYNTLPIEVFAPVTIEKHDNVVLCGPYEPGDYEFAGETVTVKACGMLPLHFASRQTGHPIVRDFHEKDISYWYDAKQDMITPLLNATFTAEGFTPVVTSSNKDANGAWKPALAVGIKEYKGKYYVLSQLDLRTENPTAKRLLKAIYDYTRS